jgi:hypothetical protein
MLALAIVTLLSFAIAWAIFSIVAYTLLYSSLILSYYFVWDANTRSQMCPKGLLHAIIHDE